MAPYADSLFAFLTLDPTGAIRLAGRDSTFRKPTPKERKFPQADQVVAKITDRTLRFQPPRPN
jgi:hypothetical protein